MRQLTILPRLVPTINWVGTRLSCGGCYDNGGHLGGHGGLEGEAGDGLGLLRVGLRLVRGHQVLPHRLADVPGRGGGGGLDNAGDH